MHEESAKAKTPPGPAALQARISATDRQIDALVYDLYGLTEEEICIVEEGNGERKRMMEASSPIDSRHATGPEGA
ncbi:MAG TPA: hypothetical protein VGZ47_01155 [Gemmataceae bacterium]|nr:hypothetical protein [Gemmataceae bacterium]